MYRSRFASPHPGSNKRETLGYLRTATFCIISSWFGLPNHKRKVIGCRPQHTKISKQQQLGVGGDWRIGGLAVDHLKSCEDSRMVGRKNSVHSTSHSRRYSGVSSCDPDSKLGPLSSVEPLNCPKPYPIVGRRGPATHANNGDTKASKHHSARDSEGRVWGSTSSLSSPLLSSPLIACT